MKAPAIALALALLAGLAPASPAAAEPAVVASGAYPEGLLWHGGKVWFELSNSFLEIEGQPPHLLSIFRDITERKIAEEKMNDFAKRLERNGTPLSTICQLTGHSSIDSLQRYLRSSAEELQSAVEGVM